MKFKPLLSLTLIVASLMSYGQSVSPNDRLYWKRYSTFSYRPYNLQLPVSYNSQTSYVQSKKITSYTTETENYKKNGKAYKTRFYRTYTFDNDGRIASLAGGRVGKTISWTNNYKYNDKGIMYILESLDKNGNVTEVQQSNYYKDLPGLYDFVKINGEGDTLEYIIQGPRDSVKNISYDYYYKKGKLKYTWFNEYYPNKQNKRTTASNGRGKVKYVWSFACKDDGVEQLKHKDTSTMCVSREYDKDSVLTKVSMTVDESGTMYKTVARYNKYKKVLFYKRTNQTKNQEISESKNTYADDGKSILSYKYTNYNKGRISSESISTYDKEGNTLTSMVKTYKKGLLENTSQTKYEYDNQNRPIVRRSLLENGQPSRVINYTYN